MPKKDYFNYDKKLTAGMSKQRVPKAGFISMVVTKAACKEGKITSGDPDATDKRERPKVGWPMFELTMNACKVAEDPGSASAGVRVRRFITLPFINPEGLVDPETGEFDERRQEQAEKAREFIADNAANDARTLLGPSDDIPDLPEEVDGQWRYRGKVISNDAVDACTQEANEMALDYLSAEYQENEGRGFVGCVAYMKVGVDGRFHTAMGDSGTGSLFRKLPGKASALSSSEWFEDATLGDIAAKSGNKSEGGKKRKGRK